VFPKRLIHIGDGEHVPLKLVPATENYKYLAFSHCWGHEKPISTTMANKSRGHQAIDWDDLPQSFQDAIIVTRGLNVRYIWIDSLCIVQDVSRDWEEESAKMGSIFGGCELVIQSSEIRHSCAGEEKREYLSLVFSKAPIFSANECPIFYRRVCTVKYNMNR
jgi:hypothetical protein